MKPFHVVAIPHQDIMQGRLTMNIFAADLWETFTSRAPLDYKDPEIFFEKTYLTEGLRNILGIVEKRLAGDGGDSVIQIQTPFGGGKTHSLIAMYHKAKIWKTNVAVIVGTTLDPSASTIWGEIARQLGSTKFQNSKISPGRDEIMNLLISHQPVLILMDELMEFMTKASGIVVGNSNLASQTLAFMQELTEATTITEKSCLIATLPSGGMEHFGIESEKYYQQLQKIFGRVEKIYTPVQDNEITKVIRKRLFSNIDDGASKKVISEFIKYAEREEILPVGREHSEYRDEFLSSYPFTPELVNILYERWGSFPNFQRTRGVLRLLALVIHNLRNSNRPYISLADFDLSNEEIKRELIKNIGSEYSGVIASDITSSDSGASKIDISLGKSYAGLKLGRRTATSIFMCSFSGGQEKGVSIRDLKRIATTIDNPASVIAEAVEKLKGNLFFLQSHQDKLFFSNEPNLNRILLTKMENISQIDFETREMQLLKRNILGNRLKVIIWPEKPGDIPDNRDLKLVILRELSLPFINKVIETKGESPRVYRNTLLFLCPNEYEKSRFIETLKKIIAYEYINSDKTLNLKDEQRVEITRQTKHSEDNIHDALFSYYRIAIVPSLGQPKEINLGVPTYGDKNTLDERVYSFLKQEGEILEKVSSLRIRDRFLKDEGFVAVGQIYDSILKTPGEIRVISFEALKMGISDGIRNREFAIGKTDSGGKIRCVKNEEMTIIDDSNLLIPIEKCLDEPARENDTNNNLYIPPAPAPSNYHIRDSNTTPNNIKTLDFTIELPRGNVSGIMGIMNLLQHNFESMVLEIKVSEGSISEKEFEEKIMEALRQLGIQLKKISKT